jgi:hypothetical protein
MDVARKADRPPARDRLGGAMQEALLLSSGEGAGVWDLVEADLQAGASVLPVPFPTEELGLVLAGRVRLIDLPFDYDVGIPLEEQAKTHVLEPGDAFRFSPGDRVWMEVLEELRLLYLRLRTPAGGGTSC